MREKPFVIGIAGGTCSGKSTLAAVLEMRLLEKHTLASLPMDGYYKNPDITTVAPFTHVEYAEHNHPDAMDIERIYSDFDAMLSDRSLDIILVEGLFTLYYEKIRERLDLKVYVDLQSDERLYRRIKRWIGKQTMEDIAARYLDTVRYRHDELVEPTRWHADLVINGIFDANFGTDILTAYIEAQLSR